MSPYHSVTSWPGIRARRQSARLAGTRCCQRWWLPAHASARLAVMHRAGCRGEVRDSEFAARRSPKKSRGTLDWISFRRIALACWKSTSSACLGVTPCRCHSSKGSLPAVAPVRRCACWPQRVTGLARSAARDAAGVKRARTGAHRHAGRRTQPQHRPTAWRPPGSLWS